LVFLYQFACVVIMVRAHTTYMTNIPKDDSMLGETICIMWDYYDEEKRENNY
jgi:hypothetical protein